MCKMFRSPFLRSNASRISSISPSVSSALLIYTNIFKNKFNDYSIVLNLQHCKNSTRKNAKESMGVQNEHGGNGSMF